MHLDLPSSAEFAMKLMDAGVKLTKTPLTIDDLAAEIAKIAGGEGPKE